MRCVSIAVLRAHLSDYVHAAKAGEEVIVTDRNRPIARLVPIAAPMRGDARLMDLIRAGLARPAVRSLPKNFWTRPRPQNRQSRALATLIEERAEGR